MKFSPAPPCPHFVIETHAALDGGLLAQRVQWVDALGGTTRHVEVLACDAPILNLREQGPLLALT